MINNDNRIVQGLWIGGRLSALERLCIRSFCAHGHEFHLYAYDKLQNLPRAAGLRLFDAEEILPRTAIFRHKNGMVAFFADHFRYELLRKKGGWWMDMDLVCMRPLAFAAPVVLSRSILPNRLWNGMLKFPRGHLLAATLADAYWDIDRILPWDTTSLKWRKFCRRLMFWRDSRRYMVSKDAGGMRGLKSAVNYFGLDDYVQSDKIVWDNPQATDNAGWTIDKVLSSAPELQCIHLSNSNFAINGLDKDGKYPPDSLYEVLKRRYADDADDAGFAD